MPMQLIDFRKVKDGKYLKNYELVYLNKDNKKKTYEIVSRRELAGPNDLGGASSGVSIVVLKEERLLLLHEFRMGVNRWVYNLCAGMLEKGETIEDCIQRELFEETGLEVKRILKILPPSYSAVAISDVATSIAFVEAVGAVSAAHSSANEEIKAAFYTREEVGRLLSGNESFSSRAQIAAFFFSTGMLSEERFLPKDIPEEIAGSKRTDLK